MASDQPPAGEKRRHALEQMEPGEVARAKAWAHALSQASRAKEKS